MSLLSRYGNHTLPPTLNILKEYSSILTDSSKTTTDAKQIQLT